MKKLIVMSLMAITLNAHAEITTQEEADAFLDGYCISLVDEIAALVEKQKKETAEKDWEAVFETGGLIASIADVYSKLCK